MICCKTEKMLVFIYMWLWLSSISSSGIHVKAENDSLKPGDTLNATSQLYSKNGKYYITFSRTYNDESTHLMIISAANEVVWMSDRNQPVDPTSAVLSLNHSGVLKIESPNVKPIILYSSPNQANATKNIVATLLDTGNFVVQPLHPNGRKSSVLWQSFDYPVDTLIPEMKLGVNRKTGHNWSLVSCLTFYLSTPGAFSLEWEPVARELIIKRRGKVCWKSGKLRNNRTFENIPEEVQRNYQYTIVSNSDEDSFSFKTITLNNKTSQTWILFENGHLGGNDKVDIARADMCYGYNNSNGCQRWEDIPTCRNPGDVFKKKIGSPNYENATYEPNTGYGITDCMAICWSNCNCTCQKDQRSMLEEGSLRRQHLQEYQPLIFRRTFLPLIVKSSAMLSQQINKIVTQNPLLPNAVKPLSASLNVQRKSEERKRKVKVIRVGLTRRVRHQLETLANVNLGENQ